MMRRLLPAALLAALAAQATLAGCAAPHASNPDVARWEARARNVTITRDDWGIPHVRGKSDADAVFGMIYAQAEDDFSRIEANYLDSQGRLAEAEGEKAIWRDLRMKLFVDPDTLNARYAQSPASLRALMDAWADGLNFFLHTHPRVKPRVIARFEPWMALSFTEGSIGGDIETISLPELERFYGGRPDSLLAAAAGDDAPREPSGSNGIALAPSVTKNRHALLLINPHTSFYFRAELQVTSDEGLNAYGASTWGQFFVYQGFNERLGWMHTSSGVDAIDEYAENVARTPGGFVYAHGRERRPVTASRITVPFRTDSGTARRTFTVYRTHHGPVVRAEHGRWIAVSLMQQPVKSLIQSYARTKARSLAEYRALMDLQANSSNNTVFASADGDIAYFHGNFVPRRDARFDWRKPVDGSDPTSDWQGLLRFDELPNVVNPASGWLYNSNNWPWTAAGANSPRRTDYPAYVENGGENPRGVHAVRLLEGGRDWTVESLLAAAYDPYLPAFAELLPKLFDAYGGLPGSSPLRAKLGEKIRALREWDLRWSVASVPTSIAVFWGDQLWRRITPAAKAAEMTPLDYMVARATPAERLGALEDACDTLTARFGRWDVPWGEVNRFQRLTDDLVHPFDDAAPSIPVGFTSSRWGSLASFAARPGEGTNRVYGTSGNSFVAIVEFGPRVRAIAVTAGGQSGDPRSKHFDDQAERYATGNLREVYFYPAQLKGHTERTYRPGR